MFNIKLKKKLDKFFKSKNSEVLWILTFYVTGQIFTKDLVRKVKMNNKSTN